MADFALEATPDLRDHLGVLLNDVRSMMVPATPELRHWLVLIVDDDPSVHIITRAALGKLFVQGRGLEFEMMLTASDALTYLQANRNVALILLDQRLETADAWLAIAREVRYTLGLDRVRIVLRSGGDVQELRKQVVGLDVTEVIGKSSTTLQELRAVVVQSLEDFAQTA